LKQFAIEALLKRAVDGNEKLSNEIVVSKSKTFMIIHSKWKEDSIKNISLFYRKQYLSKSCF